MSHTSSAKTTKPALGALLVTLLICGTLLCLTSFWMLNKPKTAKSAQNTLVEPLIIAPTNPNDLLSWPKVNITAIAPLVTPKPPLQKDIPTLETTEVKALHSLVRALNDHQFTTTPIPTIPKSQWQNRLETAVSDTRTVSDQDSFINLGAPVLLACQKSLASLQKDLKAGKLTWEAATTDPDFKEYSLYRRNCGNMLPGLKSLDLVDEKGQWAKEEAKTVAMLLGRFRWARLQNIYKPALDQLSKPEQRVYLMWRLSSSKSEEPASRLRMLKRLMGLDPSYPEVRAKVLIALDQNNTAFAKEIVSRYLNQSPNNPEYLALAKSLGIKKAQP